MGNIREAFEYASKNPNSDFAKQLTQLAKSGALNVEAKKNGIDLTPFGVTTDLSEQVKEGVGGIKGVAVGVGKGVLSTVKGIGQLGEKIGNLVIPKQFEMPSVYSDEATEGGLLSKENLTARGTAEQIGKTGEQIAEFAVPGSVVSKATKGASTVGKILPRALTSGTVATAQAGDIGKETAIATGLEVALPVAGKLVNNLVIKPLSRVIKGLGAGASGIGTNQLTDIITNPTKAEEVSKILKSKGNRKVLEEEVNKIISGVTKIKSEASRAYGDGLEKLSTVDIKPKVIKDEIKSVIENNGGKLSTKGFNLRDTEFAGDSKLVEKANKIINEINNQKDLSGRGVRQLMEMVDKTKLKTATTDTSISFNRFIDEISDGLRNSITKSTDKLDEINAIYSKDIQLSDAIQSIFGDIKFRNLEEINKVSQKIEGLASQKGLSPDILDDFFTRIGQSSKDFRTTEAVRQIMSKSTQANKMGLSFSEITQSLSGGLITPNLIKNIAILTGKTQPYIKKLIENTAPTARATVIKALIPSK